MCWYTNMRKLHHCHRNTWYEINRTFCHCNLDHPTTPFYKILLIVVCCIYLYNKANGHSSDICLPKTQQTCYDMSFWFSVELVFQNHSPTFYKTSWPHDSYPKNDGCRFWTNRHSKISLEFYLQVPHPLEFYHQVSHPRQSILGELFKFRK